VITPEQYFRGKPHTPEQTEACGELLLCVNSLLLEASRNGAYGYAVDIDTGTCISGSRGGAGDGGFRLSDVVTGAAKSSHKEARAVDVYDPFNKLDEWLTDAVLFNHGLYREHPDATLGWCHLTTRAPGSKRRTFRP
jgi:hypothetical protein